MFLDIIVTINLYMVIYYKFNKRAKFKTEHIKISHSHIIINQRVNIIDRSGGVNICHLTP